jgi:hypothetical protein
MAFRASVLGGLAALMLVAVGAPSAWAEASTTCVKATKATPPKPAKKHYTGGWNDSHCTSVNATHEGKYEKLASFSESEEQQLKAFLKYVKVQAAGVAGKPTVQFSGANVQVVNGEGKTFTKNGTGNLVVGYDENTENHEQTGSHNLILGEEQTFTSFGGIVGGFRNTISGEYASVTGGESNTASGAVAVVSGGDANKASGAAAWVGGGVLNTAGNFASVSGGRGNIASADESSVSGGHGNTAKGFSSWVGGGFGNVAEGFYSSVFGGKALTAKNEYEAIP